MRLPYPIDVMYRVGCAAPGCDEALDFSYTVAPGCDWPEPTVPWRIIMGRAYCDAHFIHISPDGDVLVDVGQPAAEPGTTIYSTASKPMSPDHLYWHPALGQWINLAT